MSENLGIATLPIDPNADPTPTVTATVVDGVLSVRDYTPGKSYIVYGEATRTHKDHLRGFGGKFNGRLKQKETGFPGGPGWIFFDQKMKPQVLQFVSQVNNGTIPTQQNVPEQGNQLGLPTVAPPVKNHKFQWVKYKVFIPRVGMKPVLKVNGNKVEGAPIYEVETHKNFVDTVWTSFGGNNAKLVICNGRWQVWGYMVEHSVFFSEAGDNADEANEEDVVNV